MKAWCPILPKDNPNCYSNALPGLANPACQQTNTLESKASEQVIIDINWQDFINLNGQPVYYYTYGYNLNRAEKIFGEDVLAPYEVPFEIKIYLEINDKPAILSNMGGLYSDDDITGYIHIKTFQNLANQQPYYTANNMRLEPKSQDVIQIISYGCDRPGDRGANYYIITNREDQLINAKINPLYGHYIWKITAKRFIYSFEPGAIEPNGEEGNNQVFDNKFNGVLPNNTPLEDILDNKVYNFNIDETSKEKVFNQNYKNQDDIYGGYY